jgi:hypothetical protein
MVNAHTHINVSIEQKARPDEEEDEEEEEEDEEQQQEEEDADGGEVRGGKGGLDEECAACMCVQCDGTTGTTMYESVYMIKQPN